MILFLYICLNLLEEFYYMASNSKVVEERLKKRRARQFLLATK